MYVCEYIYIYTYIYIFMYRICLYCLAVCLTCMEKLVPDISMSVMVIGLSLPILRQRQCCLLYDVY